MGLAMLPGSGHPPGGLAGQDERAIQRDRCKHVEVVCDSHDALAASTVGIIDLLAADDPEFVGMCGPGRRHLDRSVVH